MSGVSPWHGLGSVRNMTSTAPTPPPPDADDEQDEFERPSIQRTVPAAGATSPVSAFDHPYRPSTDSAGKSADDSAAHTEETTVTREIKPKAARKPRPAKGATARFQVCSLLMAKGDLTREELLADVSCDRTAFNNAIFNAKAAEHIVHIASTDKWHITAAGKDWTSGGANLDNHRAGATTSPAEVKRGRRQPREKGASLAKREKQRLGVIDTGAKKRKKPKTRRAAVRVQQPRQADAPARSISGLLALSEPAGIQVVQERSFRCAVISDGGFFLHKGDKQIDLTAAEHREMLNYIDRVRGVDAEPART